MEKSKSYIEHSDKESQNSDNLDFHDIAIWTLKEMLTMAYKPTKAPV